MRADGTPDVWMKANTDFSDLTDWLALKREGSASYEAEILQIYSNFKENRNNPFRYLKLLQSFLR